MKAYFPCWARAAGGSALGWVLLTGCAVGPAYHRPGLPGTNAPPTAYSEAPQASNGVPWKIAEPAAHLGRGAWWEAFGDAELNRLETLASVGNQGLAVAVARFDQARALTGVAQAERFPALNASPAYTRQRSSENQPQNGRAAGSGPTYNTFTASLVAGWEADLWGRVRSQVQAARARVVASADEVEAVRLSLQAEVAADLLTWRAVQAQIELLRTTVGAYERSVELTRHRRAGGVVSDLDVAQAETQLRSAQAQLPPLQLQAAKLRHALATLCGQSSAAFALGATPWSEPPEPLLPPVGLPSELLERRPDIAAAERRMAAANAEVGVSRAAFFPRLRLNGLAGFQSVDAGTLFDWPSRLWAVGPALDWPLFTGGRNRAQLAAARAAYDQAVAAYRQSVLTAFQEVEDQLAAQKWLAEQYAAEAAALAAARRALQVAQNRYQAGLVTYLEVTAAQSAALARERIVVQLRAERQMARVALVKALGGGWAPPGAAR